MSQHRAPGLPRMSSYADDFTPRHCDGSSCFHTHDGDQPLPFFARLDDPVVPPRCGRKGSHGAHDVTSEIPGEPANWRCPGHTTPTEVPKTRVVQRVVEARTSMKGGAR